MAESIIYAISHSSGLNGALNACPTFMKLTFADPTLPSLKRTRRYLKSLGRYGSSAFLVGQYGGAGEIAQGFCRCVLDDQLGAAWLIKFSACAVHGGTYILGAQAQPTSIAIATPEEKQSNTKAISITLPSHPRPITADHLVANSDYLAGLDGSEDGFTTAHCIAILPSLPPCLAPEEQSGDLDEEEESEKEEDAMIVVFPPMDGRNLVRALLMGEGTGSCPKGQCALGAQIALG